MGVGSTICLCLIALFCKGSPLSPYLSSLISHLLGLSLLLQHPCTVHTTLYYSPAIVSTAYTFPAIRYNLLTTNS